MQDHPDRPGRCCQIIRGAEPARSQELLGLNELKARLAFFLMTPELDHPFDRILLFVASISFGTIADLSGSEVIIYSGPAVIFPIVCIGIPSFHIPIRFDGR